jgi:hypothetical protein
MYLPSLHLGLGPGHTRGHCDSSVLETCPDYLTQLAAVSNRDSLPDSSFAFDDVRPDVQP